MFTYVYECVVFCTLTCPHMCRMWVICFFLKFVIVHHNYTCPTMCVHMYSTTHVAYMCMCMHTPFKHFSVWAPACFQYSLLLGGDYPACIWLLSAFDWKLERPGAPWEERSENFLNPRPLHPSTLVYSSTSERTLLEILTHVFSVNHRTLWIGWRNLMMLLKQCLQACTM